MRDDLDAARAVVWWAVVPLLLLLLASGSAWAAPEDTIRVCRGAVSPMDGQAEGECWGPPTGDLVVITVAELQPDDLVLGYDYVQDCWCMWFPGTLAANPSYEFRPYEPVEGTLYASFAALEWGGSGGDPDPEEPPGEGGGGGTLDNVDWSVFAGAWAASFVLCGMFWGLGKGIGIMVQFLKRI